MYELYAVLVLIVCVALGVWKSFNSSSYCKFRIWGILTMLVFAPVFSWLIGRLYALYEESGWAMAGFLIIAFPILFITGVVLYWIGDNE